jgi:tetraacyldisaccharide 4'-kinase
MPSVARGPSPAARLEALLVRHWWRRRPSLLSRLLLPLAWLYGWVARGHRHAASAPRVPVPVLVVGNFVVGGAGKTPTVIALVQALQQAGHHPGVISRGYARRAAGLRAVLATADPGDAGDEPVLIARRSSAPVWVGRDRAAAARALCAANPQVDVLVSDDGLQHHALARDAEVAVFDDRGVGNGLLLPAGPLREAVPRQLPPRLRVLYTSGRASTALPGALALPAIGTAWPLQAWRNGHAAEAVAVSALRGRPLVAAAGLAAPEKFFAMLEAAGLTITRLPLADHHDYRTLPWPAHTADVVTTEKDAVKLRPEQLGATRLWVVPLDLALPAAFVGDLLALLFGPHAAPTNHDP